MKKVYLYYVASFVVGTIGIVGSEVLRRKAIQVMRDLYLS